MRPHLRNPSADLARLAYKLLNLPSPFLLDQCRTGNEHARSMGNSATVHSGPARQVVHLHHVGLLAAALCFFLVIDWQRSFAAACSDSCQRAQLSALQELYSSLSKSPWTNSSGWVTTAPATNTSLPSYCSFHGVVCCSAAGVAVVPIAFTPPLILDCPDPGSVAGLYLVSNGLQGSLPDAPAVWEALSSLVYLHLTGEKANA